MGERRLYVRVRGKVMGPFGQSQLRAMRDRGQFRSFHEVSEDREAWTTAASLPGFFSEGAADAEPQQQTRTRKEARPTEGVSDYQPVTGSPEVANAAASPRKEPPINVIDALPLFLSDPVGALPRLCAGLRPAAAWGLGIFFYLTALASAFIGVILVAELEGISIFRDLGNLQRNPTRAEVVLRLIAVAATPLISLGGAIALIRLVTRGRGNLGTDILTAGAIALPVGLSFPVLALLGKNHEVVFFLWMFISVLPVLILNSAFTRWTQLPDRGAIFAVPATSILSLWLMKIIAVALLQDAIDATHFMRKFSPFGNLWQG